MPSGLGLEDRGLRVGARSVLERQSCDVLDWPFHASTGLLVEGERRERQSVDRKIDLISHDAADVHSA